MIEVFKTSLNNKQLAKDIKIELSKLIPFALISFDLEDCDKVLRIEANNIDALSIIEVLRRNNVECVIMHW